VDKVGPFKDVTEPQN